MFSVDVDSVGGLMSESPVAHIQEGSFSDPQILFKVKTLFSAPLRERHPIFF